jgi:hypothetical protein
MLSAPNTHNGERRCVKLRGSVVLLLALVVLGFGLVKLSGPVNMLRGQGERLAQLRSKRNSFVAERGQLRGLKRRQATEAGREATARRRGYLRRGERRLVFVHPEEPGESSDEPAETAAPQP